MSQSAFLSLSKLYATKSPIQIKATVRIYPTLLPSKIGIKIRSLTEMNFSINTFSEDETTEDLFALP